MIFVIALALARVAHGYIDLTVGSGAGPADKQLTIFIGMDYSKVAYRRYIIDMFNWQPLETFTEYIFGLSCGDRFTARLESNSGRGFSGHLLHICKSERSFDRDVKLAYMAYRFCSLGWSDSTMNAVQDPCPCEACPEMCVEAAGTITSDDCPKSIDKDGIPRANFNKNDPYSLNYFPDRICACNGLQDGAEAAAEFVFGGGKYDCGGEPCVEDDFDGCVYQWSWQGTANCDTAFEAGFTCQQLEGDGYGWDCAGCDCPADYNWVDFTDTLDYREEACEHWTNIYFNDSSHWCTTPTPAPEFDDGSGFLITNSASGAPLAPLFLFTLLAILFTRV